MWHDGLLYQLHRKGVCGKLWRVVKDIYAKGSSRARLNGVLSEPFPVRQGVAQGCPMSCILFNIHVDDLLEGVNRDCSPEGIHLSANCSLSGVGYADDFFGLSGTPGGLQRIADMALIHSLLWRWDLNVDKTHAIVFNPADICPEHAGSLKWNWAGSELQRVKSTKLLGVIMTDDCEWSAHAAYAVTKGWGAYHEWKHVLRQPYLDRALKFRIINAIIKPRITYGMEVWTPPTKGEIDAIDIPLKQAVRDALSVPSCDRALYPTVLLLHDSGLRATPSDNAAAHVRYAHKIIRASVDSLPRQIASCLPNTHLWMERANKWVNEVAQHDPTRRLADAMLKPPPPFPCHLQAPAPASKAPPPLNRIINRAIALRDAPAYLCTATKRGRSPLALAALSSAPLHRAQPYVHRRDAGALLLFRAGLLAQDTKTANDDLYKSTKRRFDALAPAFLTCPDCHDDVNDEDGSSATAYQYRIMLHRFSRCPARIAILNWYYDVAVRSVPTPTMAAMLARARLASTAEPPPPFASEDVQAFLRHLLEPSALCRPGDSAHCRRMTHAATLLITYQNVDAPRLPPADEFGPLPCIHFPNCSIPVRPLAATIDDAFWAAVLISGHSVLRPAVLAAGADEAEAPAGVRRSVRLCLLRDAVA